MFDVEVDVDKRSKQTTIINSRSLQLFHYIYYYYFTVSSEYGYKHYASCSLNPFVN